MSASCIAFCDKIASMTYLQLCLTTLLYPCFFHSFFSQFHSGYFLTFRLLSISYIQTSVKTIQYFLHFIYLFLYLKNGHCIVFLDSSFQLKCSIDSSNLSTYGSISFHILNLVRYLLPITMSGSPLVLFLLAALTLLYKLNFPASRHI